MSNQEYADEEFVIETSTEGVNAWDGEYHNVAPGDYRLLVEKAKHEPAKENAEPKIVVTFKVLAVADGNADNESQIGMTCRNNYSLSLKALPRMKQLQVACNAPLNRIASGDLVGQEIIATVYHSEGKPQVGPDGTPKPATIFANVKNERAVPQEEAPKQETKAPPVTRGQQKPSMTPAPRNGQGAPRRT